MSSYSSSNELYNDLLTGILVDELLDNTNDQMLLLLKKWESLMTIYENLESSSHTSRKWVTFKRNHEEWHVIDL